MSYVLKDPDPGRCKNFRTITHSDSYIEYLRCLDYENIRHECSFPEPTHVDTTVRNNVFNSTYTGSDDKPKPWVKPKAIQKE